MTRTHCGNGVHEPGEECDDADPTTAGNCSGCRARGQTCAQPWEIAWDPVAASATWTSDLYSFSTTADSGCGARDFPQAVGQFVAPAAGMYAFELHSDDDAALSVVRGTCSAETAPCSNDASPGSTEFLSLSLGAGETVWPKVSQGWSTGSSPGPFSLRIRPLACGDGVRVLPEECDDGNTSDGDGCSASCLLETVEVEPNDTPETGNLVAPGSIYRGSLPVGDTDTFLLDAVAGTTYLIETFVGGVGTCFGTPVETRLTIEAPEGGFPVLVSPVYRKCSQATWTAASTGRHRIQIGYPSPSRFPIAPYYLSIGLR